MTTKTNPDAPVILQVRPRCYCGYCRGKRTLKLDSAGTGWRCRATDCLMIAVANEPQPPTP